MSYEGFITDRWGRLCAALAVDEGQARAVQAEVRSLLHPWGSRRIGTACGLPSFVSADGFPAELSVSYRGERTELRLLFESLGRAVVPLDLQQAGRVLTRRLAGKPGVDIERYLVVEDLFLAANPARYRPTVWHSLAWLPGTAPRYKVYLNPQVHGISDSYGVVGEAMRRLGLSRAWRPVLEHAGALTAQGHELEFFALDLYDQQPRVKVYFRHHEMKLSEVDTVAALARRHDSARAARVRQVICGDDDVVVTDEPMTCLAFHHDSSVPEEANVYLRLPGAAGERVAEVMLAEGGDPRKHAAVLSGVPDCRPELFSHRVTEPGGPADMGVYLRFDAYSEPVREGEWSCGDTGR